MTAREITDADDNDSKLIKENKINQNTSGVGAKQTEPDDQEGNLETVPQKKVSSLGTIVPIER